MRFKRKRCNRCHMNTQHETDKHKNGILWTCVDCGLEDFKQTPEQEKEDNEYQMRLLELGDYDYEDPEDWEKYHEEADINDS